MVADARRRGIGSSPQAWGTGPAERWHSASWRFIPTGVGNGSKPVSLRRLQAVHPHRRGERTNVLAIVTASRGSSPQAWGTGKPLHAGAVGGRFIPTGVGNGSTSATTPRHDSVHPHRRGERFLANAEKVVVDGSSPQAWGTVQFPPFGLIGARFIPTGVGNGISHPPRRPIPPVHPHRRGERLLSRVGIFDGSGSSPQAWGTVRLLGDELASLRFIPTGVGNGYQSPQPIISRTVHPHRRGERAPVPW